jgi:hypothetical protein
MGCNGQDEDVYEDVNEEEMNEEEFALKDLRGNDEELGANSKSKNDVQWKAMMKERTKWRQEILNRSGRGLGHLNVKQLGVLLASLSLAVPKRFKNKRGMVYILLTFYQEELAFRVSPFFITSPIIRWNMSKLVQVLKLRFRRYSDAMIPLYAK